MNIGICPVCGGGISDAGEKNCPECGAMLDGLMLQPVAVPDDNNWGAPSDSALIDAFRLQFEMHQIVPPARWIEQMRNLMGEIEAGRRHATVAFVDICRFTELTQRLDETTHNRLLSWFYHLCSKHVNLHGGFIMSLLGDGIMIAFGAPWSFERDMQAALDALLAIREEAARGVPFMDEIISIHSGAHCGLIRIELHDLQGDKVPVLAGSTVNLAARLCEKAQINEILISDAFADSMKNYFKISACDPFLPKNFDRVIQPWAVHERQAVNLDEKSVFESPFIGRGDEISRFEAAISHASTHGFVALGVRGDAGSGKTRLVQESIEYSRSQPALISLFYCDPVNAHMLLHVALKLIEQLVNHLRDDASSPIRTFEELEAFGNRLPGFERTTLPTLGYLWLIEPHFSAVSSLPGTILQTQIRKALTHVIHCMGRLNPVWIIVEDCQWCDPISAEIISELTKLKPNGVLLIATQSFASASDSADDMAEWKIAAPDFFKYGNWEFVDLPPLSTDETRELASHWLDLDKIHPLAVKKILEETAGNPLLICELARSLSDKDRTWGDAANGELSFVLIHLLQARLDRLSRERRRLIQHGAVLGRKFSYRLLELLESAHENVLTELHVLCHAGILKNRRAGDEFLFHPGLLRDVAYGMLPERERERLHGNLALAMEAGLSREIEDSTAYTIGYHWTLNGDFRRALPYYRKAARFAIRHGLAHEAHALMQQALKLNATAISRATDQPAAISVERQQRVILAEMAGKAARMVGDLPKSDKYFEEMREFAGKVGNRQWICDAYYQFAVNQVERGEYSRAQEAINELSSASADCGNKFSASLILLRSIIDLRRSDYQSALAGFENLARRDGEITPELQADAWNNAGVTCLKTEDYHRAGACFASSREKWGSLNHQFGEASTLMNLGVTQRYLGNLGAARKIYIEAARLCESIGYLLGIAAADGNLADLALLSREWHEAELHAAKSLHYARLVSNSNTECISLGNLGLARQGLGRSTGAWQALEEALQISRKLEDPLRIETVYLIRAWVRLCQNDPHAAGKELAMLRPPKLIRSRWRFDILSATARGLTGEIAPSEAAIILKQLRSGSDLEVDLASLDAELLLARLGQGGMGCDILEADRERRVQEACQGK